MSNSLQPDKPADDGEATSPDNTLAAPNRLANLRSKLTPKKLILGGVAVLAVAGLTVGGVTISNAIAEENKAKAASEANWASAASRHKYSADDLAKAIADSQKTLLQTRKSSLDNGDLLSDLDAEIISAQGVATGAMSRDLDTTQVSRAELDSMIASLRQDEQKLINETTTLTLADKAVSSDAARRTERIAAEEEAKRRAEAKSNAGSISFEDLSRSGSSRSGEFFKLEGKIIQDAGGGIYRVNITREPGYSRDFWKDTILIQISGTPVSRLLEDDLISFTGASAGMKSYTTVMNATVTLPILAVEAGDVSLIGRAD